jgi:hypothetical protein
MSLLRQVVDELDARSTPTALIGGVAAAAHGVLRSTRDADLLATETSLLQRKTWKSLEGDGVEVIINRGDSEDRLAGVVRFRRDPEPPVDLVIGKEKWLDAVLERRKPATLNGESIPVVEAADLVLLKLDASGMQDMLDIRLFLEGPSGEALKRTIESRLPELPARLRRAWSRLHDS